MTSRAQSYLSYNWPETSHEKVFSHRGMIIGEFYVTIKKQLYTHEKHLGSGPIFQSQCGFSLELQSCLKGVMGVQIIEFYFHKIDKIKVAGLS